MNDVYGQPAERMPPAAFEAEQALLGAILTNNEAFARVVPVVKAEHFSEEVHRRIFDLMGDLIRSERVASPVTLAPYMGAAEVAPGLSATAYLARLAADTVTVVNASDYARLVRDTALRRDLIEVAGQLTTSAYEARVDTSPEVVAAAALERMRAIIEQVPRQQSRFEMDKGIGRLIDRVERIRRGEEKPQRFQTGWSELDRVLKGLHPGTIVLVSARPGMGKTILMTNIGTNVAKAGVGVIEFSLEIPEDQLQARHLSQVVYDNRTPLSYGDILEAVDLRDDEVERLIHAKDTFRGLPLIAECPKKAMTAAEIASCIHIEKKRMAAKGVTLGVVLIDYLDKIAASDRYSGQRTYEIQEIVDILKVAALAEKVCIVLLSQLNREAEKRDDKRPNAADIKSSGYLEQEAHAIIFLYRPAYYIAKTAEFRDPDNEGYNQAHVDFDKCEHDVELIIGKNRSGPETIVNLWGDVSCSVLNTSTKAY